MAYMRNRRRLTNEEKLAIFTLLESGYFKIDRIASIMEISHNTVVVYRRVHRAARQLSSLR